MSCCSLRQYKRKSASYSFLSLLKAEKGALPPPATLPPKSRIRNRYNGRACLLPVVGTGNRRYWLAFHPSTLQAGKRWHLRVEVWPGLFTCPYCRVRRCWTGERDRHVLCPELHTGGMQCQRSDETPGCEMVRIQSRIGSSNRNLLREVSRQAGRNQAF